MKAVVALLLVALVGASALSLQENEYLFAKWMKQHGKTYAVDELTERFEIWSANMAMIIKHNQDESKTYKLGMNSFGDLTEEEWKARLGIRRVDKAAAKAKHARVAHRPAKAGATPPASWDWRDHHAVNPIQNQGQCGSCWAFTSGDAVSGLWAIKTGMLFPVSVQEIIDCSSAQGNDGCNGGLPTQAFQWVIANGGICDWQEYQYTAETGPTCMSANCTNVATIKGFVNVPALDENALMTAVWGTVVSTAVEADQSVFQFYTSGIINDPSCGTNVDHGMTVVGWGTDKGVDYWQLRNMWGTAWGENGMVRVVRGKNMCGLAEMAAYPTD